jgi:hypothetical protein
VSPGPVPGAPAPQESGSAKGSSHQQVTRLVAAGQEASRLGCFGEAERHFRQALDVDPAMRTARRNLARLLVRTGRTNQSLDLWRAEWDSGTEGRTWMQDLVTTALGHRMLSLAGEYAAIVAQLRWGTGVLPLAPGAPADEKTWQSPSHPLSVPKMRHDIGQFEYLLRERVVGDEFEGVVSRYRNVLSRLLSQDPDARIPLASDEYRSIRDVYNRLVHVRETPRAPRALSGMWDAESIQDVYLDHPPGVVCVDDFLSDEALAELRLFCLESTIWSTNRYAHGRLGSFFQDGFNCPLLLQIAEELQSALPRVIGDRYPLRQLWGFKSGPTLPADATTHADFAAVNVNFWITPEAANLDPSSGGLVVYDVDAPMHWDFATYNGRSDVIRPFLKQQESRAMVIPYRQNRAVIFNSDLFHGTDRVVFAEGYENLRVNITFLYGDREKDADHRNLARGELSCPPAYPGAWRSAAFARARSS